MTFSRPCRVAAPVLFAVALIACTACAAGGQATGQTSEEGYGQYLSLFDKAGAAKNQGAAKRPGKDSLGKLEVAVLAGGCFWGVEEILRGIPGVIETEAGYSGGSTPNATCEDVHSGRTGHAESVRMAFCTTRPP